jgi:hypothetical protein
MSPPKHERPAVPCEDDRAFVRNSESSAAQEGPQTC